MVIARKIPSLRVVFSAHRAERPGLNNELLADDIPGNVLGMNKRIDLNKKRLRPEYLGTGIQSSKLQLGCSSMYLD